MSLNLAPTPQMTTRLVRKKKETKWLYVALALVGVCMIATLVAAFPTMVERATQRLVAARTGSGRNTLHGKEQFLGRRLSPFLVAIDNREDGFRGAGTLFNDEFVLTAAHNVAKLDVLHRKTDVLVSPSVLTVSIREEFDKPLQTRRVLKTWVHKAFSSGTGSNKIIDLAVLQLESPFDKRPPGARDYWESAKLATPKELTAENHGTSVTMTAFGKDARNRREAALDYVGPSYGYVVRCGDSRLWMQNNNTFCFAPSSRLPPHVCSADSGGPVSVGSGKSAVVMGVIVSSPRVSNCHDKQAPHEWGVAVSVARLHHWISSILKGNAFAATRASSISLVDHDAWTDDVHDDEVYCSSDKTPFLVTGVKDDSYVAKACHTGRVVALPKQNLTRCKQPCKLMRVRTTSASLENVEERKFRTYCHKETGQAFRFTNRREGFDSFNSMRMEVIPCEGGVPVWVSGQKLSPCPESICLETPPKDFTSSLEVVCDRVGNAALKTGQAKGFLKTDSVLVPVVFQRKVQTLPCHGGPPTFIYDYALKQCTAAEIARCRGPEATPRGMSKGVLAADSADLKEMRDLSGQSEEEKNSKEVDEMLEASNL